MDEEKTLFDQQGDTAGTPPEEAPATPTSKDRYMSRYKEAYPDTDFEDENNLYDAANANLDELDKYRTNNKALIDAIDKTPALAGMLVAARDGQNPFEWLAENVGADIRELYDDPANAKKISDALAKYTKSQSEGAEAAKIRDENVTASLAELDKVGEELGLDEQGKLDLATKVYDIIDDGLSGKISADTFKLFYKGGTYDSDVENAREEGEVKGRNEQIAEKLEKQGKTAEMPPNISNGAGAKPKETEKKKSFWGGLS